MSSAPPAYDLAPMLAILGLGLALALGPLLWFWFRRRDASPSTCNKTRRRRDGTTGAAARPRRMKRLAAPIQRSG